MSRGELLARAYSALVRLYPRDFRDAYAPDMELLFRDQLRNESRLRVVGRAVIDLAVTVPTQHLEAHMRTPNRLMPIVYLALAAAGASLVLAGGTGSPARLIIGAVITVAAGTAGIVSWRQTAATAGTSVSAAWWKFLLAAPILVLLAIIGAGVGIDAWYVGVGAVLCAVACAAVGLALGVTHALTQRERGTVA